MTGPDLSENTIPAFRTLYSFRHAKPYGIAERSGHSTNGTRDLVRSAPAEIASNVISGESQDDYEWKTSISTGILDVIVMETRIGFVTDALEV